MIKIGDGELFNLVQEAKNGDKLSMKQILFMFDPAINKMCNQSTIIDRNDLRQHLYEKIIRAIQNYNIDDSPDFFEYISLISKE